MASKPEKMRTECNAICSVVNAQMKGTACTVNICATPPIRPLLPSSAHLLHKGTPASPLTGPISLYTLGSSYNTKYASRHHIVPRCTNGINFCSLVGGCSTAGAGPLPGPCWWGNSIAAKGLSMGGRVGSTSPVTGLRPGRESGERGGSAALLISACMNARCCSADHTEGSGCIVSGPIPEGDGVVDLWFEFAVGMAGGEVVV